MAKLTDLNDSQANALKALATFKRQIRAAFRACAIFTRALREGDAYKLEYHVDGYQEFYEAAYEWGCLWHPTYDIVDDKAKAMIVAWVIKELPNILKSLPH